MEKETITFLKQIEDNIFINESTVNIDILKIYIKELPWIYSKDLTFRLLFDWHFSVCGITLKLEELHELFRFQYRIISCLYKYFDLNYQLFHLFIFHVMFNVADKSVLEIGGALPEELVFDIFGVNQYINTESPDYIIADDDRLYTNKYVEKSRSKKKTLLVNAENLSNLVKRNSIERVFSVACFEHIYNLELALKEAFLVTSNGGILYSFFAPIYSYLTDGHHGVIPSHMKLDPMPWGLHLLKPKDQRKLLEKRGISNPKHIQEILGKINFDRIPNRLLYEDYSKLLTESEYYVIRLDEVAPNYNIYKKYKSEVDAVRRSNPEVRNLHTQGFRVILAKALN